MTGPRLLLFASLGAGCTASSPLDGEAVPEFELVDLNPTSPTAGEVISPSDFRGQVSAWYFTHST